MFPGFERAVTAQSVSVKVLRGILNLARALRPPAIRTASIPLDALARTTFPLARKYAAIVF